jgi:hypothetical protein
MIVKKPGGQIQEERLKNFVDFQVSMIEQAMKCKPLFIITELKLLISRIAVPTVKRIVYSIYSIHFDENAHVVQKILRNNPEFERAGNCSNVATVSTCNARCFRRSSAYYRPKPLSAKVGASFFLYGRCTLS